MLLQGGVADANILVAIFPYFPHISGMKTTMEIPSDLYRRAKTRAAAENRKIKDLVTEGLMTVLEREVSVSEPNESSEQLLSFEQVLKALDEILLCPASPAGRTAELQEDARRIRAEGWNSDDMPK